MRDLPPIRALSPSEQLAACLRAEKEALALSAVFRMEGRDLMSDGWLAQAHLERLKATDLAMGAA